MQKKNEKREKSAKQPPEDAISYRTARQSLAEVRQRARKTKMVELAEEAKILAESYERKVFFPTLPFLSHPFCKIDAKDNIISSLSRDLEESERQFLAAFISSVSYFSYARYQTLFRSHLSNVDNLITIQQERFAVLESEMNEDMDDITKAHEDEQFPATAFYFFLTDFPLIVFLLCTVMKLKNKNSNRYSK